MPAAEGDDPLPVFEREDQAGAELLRRRGEMGDALPLGRGIGDLEHRGRVADVDPDQGLGRTRRAEGVEERKGRSRAARRVDYEVRQQPFLRPRAVFDQNGRHAVAARRRHDRRGPGFRAQLDVAFGR